MSLVNGTVLYEKTRMPEKTAGGTRQKLQDSSPCYGLMPGWIWTTSAKGEMNVTGGELSDLVC